MRAGRKRHVQHVTQLTADPMYVGGVWIDNKQYVHAVR